MSYLLDTCVISELRKKVPLHVVRWFESRDEDLFFISAVTVAELFDGIERLSPSKKKEELIDWFHGDVIVRFNDRILPIDERVAKKWGHLSAYLRKSGHNVGIQDLYIAATASVYALAVVTLNFKDFKNAMIDVVNPWEVTI